MPPKKIRNPKGHFIKNPEQYLWMYNRYKHPSGAPLPPS